MRPASESPAWLSIVLVQSVVLVFVGERVLAGTPELRLVATGLGVAGAVLTWVARLRPRYRFAPERRALQRLFVVSHGICVLGLLSALVLAGWVPGPLLGVLEEAPRATAALAFSSFALVMIASLSLGFAEAALLPMRDAARYEGTRVREAAVTGATLALVLLYGGLSVYAVRQLGLRADYSYFKPSIPSAATVEVLADNAHELAVYAFLPPVGDVRSGLERYTAELGRALPKLTVSQHDRLLEPQLAAELNVAVDGALVLKRGSQRALLTLDPLAPEPRKLLRTLDRDFQAVAIELTRGRRLVYFTTGHGELEPKQAAVEPGRGLDSFVALLERQGFAFEKLGMTTGLGKDVPADASLVAVVGPSRPFASEELASLYRYAERGGRLLLALDPELVQAMPSPGGGEPGKQWNPTLGQLAGLAGLEVGRAVLHNERVHVERRSDATDQGWLLLRPPLGHATTKGFAPSPGMRRNEVVVAGATGLESSAAWNGVSTVILQSERDSWPDLNENRAFDRGETRRNYAIGVAAERQHPPREIEISVGPPGTPKKKLMRPVPPLRVFVVGDADWLTDAVWTVGPGNELLASGVLSWLEGREGAAPAARTVEEDLRVVHTKQQDLVWFYSAVMGVPGVVFGLGWVWSRRRTRRGARS
jgi:hypothetical protein